MGRNTKEGEEEEEVEEGKEEEEEERERERDWGAEKRGKKSGSAITEHLRGAQPNMEQSQISIRPNREYTPAPPFALLGPQRVGRCRGCRLRRRRRRRFLPPSFFDGGVDVALGGVVACPLHSRS